MCVGEYDVCDVTLSVHPHRGKLKSLPDHGGNRTRDLWDTNPMLCQLSYEVKSVRVDDISELSLVPRNQYLLSVLKYIISQNTLISKELDSVTK